MAETNTLAKEDSRPDMQGGKEISCASRDCGRHTERETAAASATFSSSAGASSALRRSPACRDAAPQGTPKTCLKTRSFDQDPNWDYYVK